MYIYTSVHGCFSCVNDSQVPLLRILQSKVSKMRQSEEVSGKKEKKTLRKSVSNFSSN